METRIVKLDVSCGLSFLRLFPSTKLKATYCFLKSQNFHFDFEVHFRFVNLFPWLVIFELCCYNFYAVCVLCLEFFFGFIYYWFYASFSLRSFIACKDQLVRSETFKSLFQEAWSVFVSRITLPLKMRFNLAQDFTSQLNFLCIFSKGGAEVWIIVSVTIIMSTIII